ncbi:MAG: RNA polymerase sigma factor [Lachnospiraceae bacterium]
MEDNRIVDLYWERDENAIRETSAKYGRYLHTIAYHILYNQEDADESVNDTYMNAWESIPPHRPSVLSAFVGKITRRISLNKWRDKTRGKRGGGQVPLALDELSECIASDQDVEQVVELKELSHSIDHFLRTLPETERDVFVSRYWFLASVREISSKFEFSESKTKSMLFRTREKLKKYLWEEGLI